MYIETPLYAYVRIYVLKQTLSLSPATLCAGGAFFALPAHSKHDSD